MISSSNFGRYFLSLQVEFKQLPTVAKVQVFREAVTITSRAIFL